MALRARQQERLDVLAEGDPLPPDDRVLLAARCPVETLYREERPGLLRFLRRRMSNDNAGDLVQQAFVRFLGLGPARRAGIANPTGYLRRTAYNLALDDAKTDSRRAASRHVPADDLDLCAPDQLAALEARDMLRHLEQAMRRWKPRTREIFLAHRVDGYSYIEIAAMTGLSVKGVEKHMSQAIALVDRALSGR